MALYFTSILKASTLYIIEVTFGIILTENPYVSLYVTYGLITPLTNSDNSDLVKDTLIVSLTFL